MKIKKVLEYLESIYPSKIAETWDRVGLQTGNEEEDLKKIVIALDLTEEVIKYVFENNVNLIILHHNPWFDSNLTINQQNVQKTFSNQKICVFVIHTNFDCAPHQGMKRAMQNVLKLKKIYEFDDVHFFGFIWIEDVFQNISQISSRIKQLPFSSPIYYYGDDKAAIKKIAFLPGGGKDFVPLAILKKVDLFITGDLNWHAKLLASEENLNLLEINHSAENVFCKQIQLVLSENSLESAIFNPPDIIGKKMF